MKYSWLNFLVLLPIALLMFGGAVLWRRKGSPATALIAAGFATYFIGSLAGYLTGAWFLIGSDSMYTVSLVTHYASVVGAWVAGAGLVWHALSK
jgi:hypothetical protein